MSGVIHEIGHALSDIVHTIGSALSDIINTIGHVLSVIWHGIVDALKAIYDFLSHNIIVVAIILVIVVIVVAIFAPEILPAIYEAIKSFIVAIPAELEGAASSLLGLWEAFKASWVAQAALDVYKGLQVIQRINQAAIMIRDFETGKWEAAVSMLFNEILPTVAKEFDGKIQAVINDSSKVYDTINNDITSVAIKVEEVNTGLGQLQTDFYNIGDAFGVKQISELGNAIGEFRKGVLTKFTQQADQFQNTLSSVFFTALNPFIQWDSQYHLILQNNQEAMDRLRGLVGWALPANTPANRPHGFALDYTGSFHKETRTLWLRILSRLQNP